MNIVKVQGKDLADLVKQAFPDATGVTYGPVAFEWVINHPVGYKADYTHIGVQLMLKRQGKNRRVFRRVAIRDGQIDLGVLRAKYDELIAIAAPLKAQDEKRISAIPHKLEVGRTWIYLIHKRGILRPPPEEPLPPGEDGPEPQYDMAIFAAFVPQRLEMPIWESQATPEYLAELEKRGIVPVRIPDGDKDHALREKSGRAKYSPRAKAEQAGLPLEEEEEPGTGEEVGQDE